LPFYDDNSRGAPVPKRAAASYAVVISSQNITNNQNDDGSAGFGPTGPYGFFTLKKATFDAAVNQNLAIKILDVIDGTSNTAAIGERWRHNDDPGTNGHGGWGTFGLASPHAQNGHNLFSGATGLPFNPVIPNPASDTTHLIGFSSRHSGGLNMLF